MLAVQNSGMMKKNSLGNIEETSPAIENNKDNTIVHRANFIGELKHSIHRILTLRLGPR